MRFTGTLRRFGCALAVLATIATMAAVPAHGQEVDGPQAQAAADAGPSGALVPAGGYPRRMDIGTVSYLPDGALLMVGAGARLDPDASPEMQADALRKRGSGGSFGARPEPMRFDPAAHGWRRLPNPPECATDARYLHTATVLRDGKVLLAGGLCDFPKTIDDKTPQRPHTALSLWDGGRHEWLAAPALRSARMLHTASLMADGSVLFVGGEGDPALSQRAIPVIGNVERYRDGAVLSAAPLLQARARHTATVLADGRVLVTGGFDEGGQALAVAEVYDPVHDAWSRTLPLAAARYGHAAVLLDDGRVLVAGGKGIDGAPLATTEIWDPRSASWSAGPSLPTPLYGHALARLASGEVLAAGGNRIDVRGQAIPWAWTWRPGLDLWQVAGQTVPLVNGDMDGPVGIVPQGDGALVFTPAAVLRWQPRRPGTGAGAPAWQPHPLAAPLPDGRLLVIGRLAGESGASAPAARVWSARDDTWRDAGTLKTRAWLSSAAIGTPSGAAVHVSLDQDRTLHCERWNPNAATWSDCGDLALPGSDPAHVVLGLLPDGRVAALTSRQDLAVLERDGAHWTRWPVEWHTDGLTFGAPVRPTQPLARASEADTGRAVDISDLGARYWRQMNWRAPAMLWDAKRSEWAYIFPFPKQGMGADAAFLPGGCALSTNPLALYDPGSGAAAPLQDPGFGVDMAQATMTVLDNGEVVLVGPGMRTQDAGAGFFHRRASCSGFAPAGAGSTYFAADLITDNPPAAAAPAPAPAAAPAAPGAPATGKAWRKAAAIAGGAVLLLLVGWGVWRHGLPHMGAGSLAWRVVLYGGILLVMLPPVVRRFSAPADAADAAAAAVDVAEIPCAMIGTWTARHDNAQRRVELRDDGTYRMGASISGGGDRASEYRGKWKVRDAKMTWLDTGNTSGEPDVNEMLDVADGQFTLVEGNGSLTKFERIKATPSQHCTR